MKSACPHPAPLSAEMVRSVKGVLHDVQNCMCEFSKYCRAVLGEGKPKAIYKPETEF